MGEQLKKRNCTGEMLEKLYKNVNAESDSLTGMVSKVKGTELSSELTSQINGYGELMGRIQAELFEATSQTPEKSVLSKMTARLGTEISTLTDSSDERIAQLAIEGATMGITDNIRLVRDYENSNCKESALSLARSVVSFQEQAVERTKGFL